MLNAVSISGPVMACGRFHGSLMVDADQTTISGSGPAVNQLRPLEPRLLALARRYPVTIVVAAIVAAVGLATEHHSRAQMNDLMATYGMTWNAVRTFDVASMPVSTVMQSDPGFPWIILFFVFSSLFALETIAGSVAAGVTFFAADWISSPLTAIAVKALSLLDDHEASRLVEVGSTGSSAAFHGAFAAGAMLLPRRWSKLIVLIMIAVVIFQFIFERLDNSIAHAIATVVGAALAHFVWRPRLERSATRQPRPAIS